MRGQRAREKRNAAAFAPRTKAHAPAMPSVSVPLFPFSIAFWKYLCEVWACCGREESVEGQFSECGMQDVS